MTGYPQPAQVRAGQEIIHLYRKLEECIGREKFREAKNRKNAESNSQIFDVLQNMGLLTYRDSATLTYEAFSSVITDLHVASKGEIIARKEGFFYKDQKVDICFLPYVSSRIPQVILPYNEYLSAKQERENYSGGGHSSSQSPAHSTHSSQTNTSANEKRTAKEVEFSEIVRDALLKQASDIYITYSDKQYNVLFEIRGKALHQTQYHLPVNVGKNLVKHIMVDAGQHNYGNFDVENEAIAQDAKLPLPSLGVNVRLSFIPDGQLGHICVTARIHRIEEWTHGDYDFVKDGGYGEDIAVIMEKVKHMHSGMVVASGVTGSGKSTLLARTITTLPGDGRIYTIEDPIEIRFNLPWITQHEIYKPGSKKEDKKPKEMSWEQYIRALKRAAPKRVMIGELRKEKGLAESIAEMAEAGQLVLTTTHITSAFKIYGALDKIFGIPFSSSAELIHLSINQTLVKQICPHCRVPDDENKNQKKLQALLEAGDIQYIYQKRLKAFVSHKSPPLTYLANPGKTSCNSCKGTGYIDRVPVYEYLKPTVEFKQWISTEKPDYFSIEDHACKEGNGKNKLTRYIEMLEEGILDTSDEILRAIL